MDRCVDAEWSVIKKQRFPRVEESIVFCCSVAGDIVGMEG